MTVSKTSMGQTRIHKVHDTPTLARAMTIIETAKLKGLDPQAYLADVLDRIHDHKIKKLDELLPWNWKARHPEASRQAA